MDLREEGQEIALTNKDFLMHGDVDVGEAFQVFIRKFFSDKNSRIAGGARMC